ncbi:RidA family protein [Fretibacter rubidus]|uniref:RidA family protein n=1 Tax=Fretibacter rubidus TaxID=570162 RepID=UPI00352ABF07
MNPIDEKLQALNISLPEASAPAANYVSYTRTGNLVFIAGQTSVRADGTMLTGRLGEDLTLEEGQLAARLCGLRLIAQMKAACDGDLSRVVKIVKLGGFVCSLPQSSGGDIPQIINGCSNLMVEVFGEIGKHARFAVGSPSLPRDAAVEIDAIVEIRD